MAIKQTSGGSGKGKGKENISVLGGIVYGGGFEISLNKLFNSVNIKTTATAFRIKFSDPKTFSLGSWAKDLMPKPDDWDNPKTGGFDNWTENVKTIPDDRKAQISNVIATNLSSVNPLPMVFQIQNNVDKTHDVWIKYFIGPNGQSYIGILLLCPNPNDPT
jgi:hypothetical protein